MTKHTWRTAFALSATASILLLGGTTAIAASAADPGRIQTFTTRCLDVQLRSTENGTPIQQNSCNGTEAQNFRVVPVGDSTVEIRTFADKCVDVELRSPENDTPIQQYTCNNTPAQRFTLLPVFTEKAVQIRTFAGKCFEVSGGTAALLDGAALTQQVCSAAPAQRFLIDLPGVHRKSLDVEGTRISR